MRRTAVVILLFFGGLLAPAHAQDGPSFDCLKAASFQERAICASPELSDLDMQIANDYKMALAEGKVTAAEQAAWLRYRNQTCTSNISATCLQVVLKHRHEFLLSGESVDRSKGPSFDCAKAQNRNDKIICADAYLSALDWDTDRAFESASRETFLGPEDWQQWPNTRARICSTEKGVPNYCLADFMRRQLESLSERAQYDEVAGVVTYMKYDRKPYPIDSHAAKLERIAAFSEEKALKDTGAEIESCEHLMQVDAGQNHSYGGLCVVNRRGTKTRNLICNDEIVGHFNNLDAKDRPIGEREVGIFVAVNCVGG